jgi:hypothetical protein
VNEHRSARHPGIFALKLFQALYSDSLTNKISFISFDFKTSPATGSTPNEEIAQIIDKKVDHLFFFR